MSARLVSIGSYVPSKCISNDDLAKIVDTSDEWISKRTGIKTRYFAKPHEAASDLGTNAAKIALERAQIPANALDLVICATMSGDFYGMPATACVIANNLGLKNTPAFDISAACSGFIYALFLAKNAIQSGAAKCVLIIGAEKISSFLDMTDRTTCVLFGDGAGAAIIAQSEFYENIKGQKEAEVAALCEKFKSSDSIKNSQMTKEQFKNKEFGILDVKINANGEYAELLGVPGGGSRTPLDAENLSAKFLQMKGNEVFKIAVRTLSSSVLEILEKNSLSANEIDLFVPHQANLRIISAVAQSLNFPMERTALSVEKFGNTSAASIPMALDELYKQGRLKLGDRLLLDAFGSGFTWGSALICFG